MLPDTMRALVVDRDATGAISRAVRDLPTSDLPPGEVTIQVAWSSLNYKDALAATGHAGIVRRFPHVPGIDAAGQVVESTSLEFAVGDEVLVTGFDLGQNIWGGFASYVRVPAAWVFKLPLGLSTRESMVLGTAGLTAALSVRALAARGVAPHRGEIVVTGATGGVGSLGVALLARQGYRVVASTGKPHAGEWLEKLGASRVIGREELVDASTKPLLPAKWAGAIDTVGGATLATLVRSLAPGGAVAACGLVGGTELNLSVYPFLLRGVDLVGIDSAFCPRDVRQEMWARLAGDWRLANLEHLAEEVDLASLDAKIGEILAGRVRGRVVVRVA